MATLLGINLSPFVRKTLVYIYEAGIEIEHDNSVLPIEANKERLTAINPRGKIPAYQDDDIKLGESSVICAYLERKHGASGLYPEPAADYGMALWYEKWAEEEMVPVMGTIFFNRVAKPMLGDECDEAAVAQALEKLPPLCEFLEQGLSNTDVLVGSQFSIADISVISPFVGLVIAGESIDGASYPNLSRYLKLHAQRDSIAKVLSMAGGHF